MEMPGVYTGKHLEITAYTTHKTTTALVTKTTSKKDNSKKCDEKPRIQHKRTLGKVLAFLKGKEEKGWY